MNLFLWPSARPLTAPSHPRAFAASYSARPACLNGTSAIHIARLHGSRYRLVLLTTLFPGLGVGDIADDLLCCPLPVLHFSTNERRHLLASRIVDAFLGRMKRWVVVLRHNAYSRVELFSCGVDVRQMKITAFICQWRTGMTQPNDARGRLGFATLIWQPPRSKSFGVLQLALDD
jgi:hypothetical protein